MIMSIKKSQTVDKKLARAKTTGNNKKKLT